MLRKIYLHGLAGRQFTKMVELDVATVGEAIRAIDVFYKGFRKFVVDHHFTLVFGDRKKGWSLGEENLTFKLPKGALHITPVVEGSKENGAMMKIVAGVLIAAVAWWAAPAIAGGALGSAFATGGILSGLTGNLAMMGIGLAATGISQLLSGGEDDKDKKDTSFMLSGQLNQTNQGGPVPLIYGRTDVSSTLISAGLETVDIPIGTSEEDAGTGGGWN